MAVDERKGIITFDDSDQPVNGAKIKVIDVEGWPSANPTSAGLPAQTTNTSLPCATAWL